MRNLMLYQRKNSRKSHLRNIIESSRRNPEIKEVNQRKQQLSKKTESER